MVTMVARVPNGAEPSPLETNFGWYESKLASNDFKKEASSHSAEKINSYVHVSQRTRKRLRKRESYLVRTKAV